MVNLGFSLEFICQFSLHRGYDSVSFKILALRSPTFRYDLERSPDVLLFQHMINQQFLNTAFFPDLFMTNNQLEKEPNFTYKFNFYVVKSDSIRIGNCTMKGSSSETNLTGWEPSKHSLTFTMLFLFLSKKGKCEKLSRNKLNFIHSVHLMGKYNVDKVYRVHSFLCYIQILQHWLEINQALNVHYQRYSHVIHA